MADAKGTDTKDSFQIPILTLTEARKVIGMDQQQADGLANNLGSIDYSENIACVRSIRMVEFITPILQNYVNSIPFSTLQSYLIGTGGALAAEVNIESRSGDCLFMAVQFTSILRAFRVKVALMITCSESTYPGQKVSPFHAAVAIPFVNTDELGLDDQGYIVCDPGLHYRRPLVFRDAGPDTIVDVAYKSVCKRSGQYGHLIREEPPTEDNTGRLLYKPPAKSVYYFSKISATQYSDLSKLSCNPRMLLCQSTGEAAVDFIVNKTGLTFVTVKVTGKLNLNNEGKLTVLDASHLNNKIEASKTKLNQMENTPWYKELIRLDPELKGYILNTLDALGKDFKDKNVSTGSIALSQPTGTVSAARTHLVNAPAKDRKVEKDKQKEASYPAESPAVTTASNSTESPAVTTASNSTEPIASSQSTGSATSVIITQAGKGKNKKSKGGKGDGKAVKKGAKNKDSDTTPKHESNIDSVANPK